ARLLLPGDGLALPLAGPRVRLGPLTADGQPLAVADALVATDLDLPANVGLDLAAEVAFDLVVRLDVVTDRHQLGVGELVDAQVGVDPRRLQNLLGAGTANPVDVGEGDLQPLVAGEVDAYQAGHSGHSPFLVAEVLRRTSLSLPWARAPASVRGSPTRFGLHRETACAGVRRAS